MTLQGPRTPLSDCRDCGAPIRFVSLNTGSVMPVNPLPNPLRGNVACHMSGGRLNGHVISRDHPAGAGDTWLMTPHHATCPERQAARPDPHPVLF